MFVSSNQIYVFLACVTIGCCCGVFLSVSHLLKIVIKNKILTALCDIIAFLLISLVYVAWSHHWRFPSFRMYMMVGLFLGLVLYMKSFHIILAKFIKKLYTILVRLLKPRKVKSKDG